MTPSPPSLPGRHGTRRAALFGAAAALVALVPALVLDVAYFRNGVTVEWRTAIDDEEEVPHAGEVVVVATTTEHDVRFRNDHRPLARYVQHWVVGEHGLPSTIPDVDARIRARLRVPGTHRRRPAVLASGDVEVRLDGELVTPDTLAAPGWHELEVLWRGDLGPETSLELRWDGDNEPIDRADLLPIDGSWPDTRVAYWLWALLVVATAAALGVRAGLGVTFDERTLRLTALATLAVVVWGVGLRAWDYDVEPEFRDNYDEYFDMWNGWSLLEDGHTRAWSAYPGAYPGDAIEVEHFPFWGVALTVMRPYFENLPLMHVLAGAACHLGGTDDYRDCHHADGRLVSIALSGIALLLLVAIGRRLMPSGPGPWLAALLWGSVPPLVLQSRVVKEEQLVVVLLLGVVWAFLRWRDDGRRPRDLALASVLAGLGVMAKLPAILVIPALVVLVLVAGDAKAAGRAAGIAIATIAATYVPFVLYEGLDVYLHAQAAQVLQRGVSFLLFPRFFDLAMVNGLPFGRGWAIFLWLAAVGGLYAWRPERRAIVVIPLTLYLVGIAYSAANYSFGWYALPVFALLVLPAGSFLADLWREPDLLRGVLFGTLYVMYSLHFVFDPGFWADPVETFFVRRMVAVVLLALVVPYGLVQIWPRLRRVARTTFVLSLGAALYANAFLVARWEWLGPLFRNMERFMNP